MSDNKNVINIYTAGNKIINFVSDSSESYNSFKTISDDLYFDIKHNSSIRDLFPLISNSNYHTDLIVIDVENCKDLKNTDISEVINTISTLISYTVCRKEGDEKPTKRHTNIAAFVSKKTDLKVLKELLRTNIIGIISHDIDIPNTEKRYAIHEILREKRYIPRQIQELLTSHKKTEIKKKKDTIVLTDRQAEILKLIRERGCSNKVIAKILNISESTVKLHISAILKKYNVKTRTQLAIFSDI